ncbi:MAG: recombination mediator RecR [Chloroherpetonaceae bacterium]|nr:recombination mediator RecR [Chthonomonadaceae bacterium]MDW8208397.1 recombination mediator RecR [Chloroherpetonaceae bacterium]
MAHYAKPLARLVAALERLPGVGPKSAQRMAFHILRHPEEEARQLAEAILAVKQSIHFCRECSNFTDQELCDICADPGRDRTLLCVVAEPRDLIAMEKTNEYRGLYHVLQGLICPLEGIGPEMLRIRELFPRVANGVQEVILALNPTTEGQTTTMYLASRLKPLGVKVTQIAYGIPAGGDLDYADQATLISALQWRREIL